MARWWASCRLLGHELGLSSTTVPSFSSKMPQNVRHFVYIFLSFVFQSVSVSVFQSVLLESCSRPLARKDPKGHLQSFSSLAFACSFCQGMAYRWKCRRRQWCGTKAWHGAGLQELKMSTSDDFFPRSCNSNSSLLRLRRRSEFWRVLA